MLCLFSLILLCSPVVGFSQHADSTESKLRLPDLEVQVLVDSVRSERNPQRLGAQVFDTYPMPNAYQGDRAVALPNAYRGDNCVPMPNAYQAAPSRFTIKSENSGKTVPDSVLMDILEKAKAQQAKGGRP